MNFEWIFTSILHLVNKSDPLEFWLFQHNYVALRSLLNDMLNNLHTLGLFSKAKNKIDPSGKKTKFLLILNSK